MTFSSYGSAAGFSVIRGDLFAGTEFGRSLFRLSGAGCPIVDEPDFLRSTRASYDAVAADDGDYPERAPQAFLLARKPETAGGPG